MVDESKKQKKSTITEEDASNLIQRYSVETVLALLQEVAQVPGDKIDWNAIVKNTATGISSAKEYQALWRHLAYGQNLLDQSDDDENPMDDDSDLEYEREASPAVSREASAEAAACVKVLIASGQNDLHLPNSSTIDAPLTINIPNSKAHTATSDSSSIACAFLGTNVSIPVTVQKQPLSSGTCGEKRPNGSTEINFPPRKRRRGWSTEDDAKLTSAVQKFGERNWTSIARGDFKNDRKASELSQRWASLRKKQGNSNVGTSSQLSETQLAAAHRAMSLALDMPMGDTLKMAGQSNTIGTKPQLQSLKASASRPEQSGTAMPVKPSVPTKGLPINPITSADSMVKAAAVAAGARIATATDASSLLEAARSQNVVHIKTGAVSAIKSSSTSTTNQLPSNVHFIRNGLAKALISSPAAATPLVSRPGEASKIQASMPSAEVAKATEDVAVVTSASEMKDPNQKDGGCNQDDIPVDDQSSQSEDKVEKQQSSASSNISKESASGDQNTFSFSDQTPDNQIPFPCIEVDEGETKTENLCASKEIQENPKPNMKDDDLQSNPTANIGSGGE
ncbi:uncharacterized protein LOC142543002 isoform X2 [Primulina tabacum]|uniref:uncharacterized protein LOC142543002 isoform X2 n=1 Tax=Primulina tabacum TaxID=48773 RepID=UPI003F59A70E